MKLMVEDILKLDCMKNIEIIAGKTGLKNTISNTTIMDVPDIYKWLHGNELIFVAKLFYECTSEEFLLNLRKKSVAAVFTKSSYISKLNENLKKICDDICLPIIVVEENVSWVDITYPITRLIAQKQYDAIYKSQLFHSELMNSLIDGKSLNQLCNDVYEISGLNISIIDIDFSISGCSSNFCWEKALNRFSLDSCTYKNSLAIDINDNSTSGYIYNNIYLNTLSKHVFIFPIIQEKKIYSYISLLMNKEIQHLDVADSMKVSQLSLIISLIKVKQFEISNINRRYNNLMLDLILQGKMNSQKERIFIEKCIQHNFEDFYYIVVAQSSNLINSNNMLEYSLKASKLFELISNNSYEFEGVLCFERGDVLVFFIPKFETNIERTVKELYKLTQNTLISKSLYFGISNITNSSELIHGFKQATQALKYAQLNSNTCFYYRDLGILRFFIDKNGDLNMQALIELRDKYIKPLREYDNNNDTQLEETLNLLVRYNFSKVSTANTLFIHKNTLRARLAKIEEILNCNLSNSEDIFNIQLAMKIDYSLTNN